MLHKNLFCGPTHSTVLFESWLQLERDANNMMILSDDSSFRWWFFLKAASGIVGSARTTDDGSIGWIPGYTANLKNCTCVLLSPVFGAGGWVRANGSLASNTAFTTKVAAWRNSQTLRQECKTEHNVTELTLPSTGLFCVLVQGSQTRGPLGRSARLAMLFGNFQIIDICVI